MFVHSTKYFKEIDGDPDTLAPDIYAESTFGDYIKGADLVLQAIINYGK